jgi:hypothetical protein
MPWQIHDLLIDLDRYSTHTCIWLALKEYNWDAWSDGKSLSAIRLVCGVRVSPAGRI